MLFLEGATDLAILRALCRKTWPEHAAALDDVPVYYLNSNVPDHAQDIFQGLLEAYPKLLGVAVFDRITRPPSLESGLTVHSWKRREIENYFVGRAVLERFARRETSDDLFGRAEAERRVETMKLCIDELERALAVQGKPSPWSPDLKVTDEFLDPLFRNFYSRLGVPQLVYKRDYFKIADELQPGDIDAAGVEEIRGILSSIIAAQGVEFLHRGADA